MSRLKSNDYEVVRLLRRDARWAWRSPSSALRRRVVASLGERACPASTVHPLRGLAWAATWAILVGIAGWLVVRVVPLTPDDPVQPAVLSLGEVEVQVDRIDELVASYEEPLRAEARLLVADARTMHAALMRRLPYSTSD